MLHTLSTLLYVPLQSTLRIYGRRCWFPFSNKHRFGVRRGRFPSLSPSRSFLGQEKYQCPPSSGSVAIPSGPLARPDTPSPPPPCCLRLSFFDPKGETPSLSPSSFFATLIFRGQNLWQRTTKKGRSDGGKKEEERLFSVGRLSLNWDQRGSSIQHGKRKRKGMIKCGLGRRGGGQRWENGIECCTVHSQSEFPKILGKSLLLPIGGQGGGG